MLHKCLNRFKNFLYRKTTKPISFKVPNPRDSDIYIVSYPKSGNTWMRYLMAYATWPELMEIDLVEMASYVPSYGIKHDCERMLDANAPCNQLKHRLIKEHTAYNAEAKKTIKRAIYVVRDGRDAIVSYWHFCNQRDGTAIPFSEFIEASAGAQHSYGKWSEHVQSWLDAELDAKLVIRYEDLLSDTAFWLKKALAFAEIQASDEVVAQAVQRASFNSMRNLENSKGFNLDQLKNVDFVRKGKAGSWVETFGPEDIEKFVRFHGAAIRELGYEW